MPDSTRVAELAVRIDWLIARQHAENAARNVALANGATPGERREFHWRARAIADETAAAQAELAAIFAERHGWRQTRRPFSVGCLAVQGSMGTAMRDGHGRCWIMLAISARAAAQRRLWGTYTTFRARREPGRALAVSCSSRP